MAELSAAEVCTDCEPPSSSTIAASGSSAPAQSAPASHGQSVAAGSKEKTMETTATSDLLDSKTFVPPLTLPAPRAIIEYCDRCRWQHRASWTQTELLLTFAPSDTLPNGLRGVTIIPRRDEVEAGRWRIWIVLDEAGHDVRLVWDRKIEGGFGEMKELKKKIRDVIAPNASLGHSDGHQKA